MAAKAALRYAIGRYMGNLSALKVIDGRDIERGINFAERSSNDLNKLFTTRVGLNERTAISDEVKMLRALERAPNRMYNSESWWKNSGIKNRNKFTRLKKELLEKGSVCEADKSSITDEEEISRLKIESNNRTIIYTVNFDKEK